MSIPPSSLFPQVSMQDWRGRRVKYIPGRGLLSQVLPTLSPFQLRRDRWGSKIGSAESQVMAGMVF